MIEANLRQAYSDVIQDIEKKYREHREFTNSFVSKDVPFENIKRAMKFEEEMALILSNLRGYRSCIPGE